MQCLHLQLYLLQAAGVVSRSVTLSAVAVIVCWVVVPDAIYI